MIYFVEEDEAYPVRELREANDPAQVVLCVEIPEEVVKEYFAAREAWRVVQEKLKVYVDQQDKIYDERYPGAAEEEDTE